MKHILLSLSILCMSLSAWAQQTISIDAVPTSVEDFLALRDKISGTPEGGAALYITALLMYNKDKSLGTKALIIASDKQLLVESSSEKAYKGYFFTPGYDQSIRNYYEPKPYIAQSYIDGTKPEEGYKAPAGAMKMVFTRNPYSEQDNGDIKVFVKCSGAASARPITLSKNDKGIWKVINYSSLIVGVMPPGKEVDDL